MKRYGNLWEKFISMDNMRDAFNKAKKGRGRNSHVRKILDKQRNNETRAQYLIRREKRIKRYLQHLIYILESGKFSTSEYMLRDIKDPKPRTLYILPLYPDRIVQHALVNVLRPIWEKQFIHDSYACRKGKGQHKCSNRVWYYVKHYKYCALIDIKKFYPSIPHEEMYTVVEKKIKDKKILALIKDIIFSIGGGKNIPIGNLTSQWLGNLYLNELDQYVAHVLKIKAAPRYTDDKAFFSDDKKELREKVDLAEKFITEKLKLQLSKKIILRCDHGVPFIGYRHFPEYVLLKKRTAKRIRRKLPKMPERLNKKRITLIQYASTLSSFNGWASFGNTYNFRRKIGLDVAFESARKQIKEVKMRGFPKYTDIATKYDVENLKNIFPNETRAFLESLKADRFIWVDNGVIPAGGLGINDDTHKVVEVTNANHDLSDEVNTKELHQLEKVEDPNARVFRMGYTLEQIDWLLESLS